MQGAPRSRVLPAAPLDTRIGWFEMAEMGRFWDASEWEEHCMDLLRIRFGHELQEIPSGRKRDYGIEAFTRDGAIYQCYSPLEPLSTKDRYAAQRDKLTEDLGKLKANADKLAELFGDLKVKRYVFMVPRFDGADLPAHASQKASVVRSWDLPFVDGAFEVVAVTDASYPEERARLIALGAVSADIEIPSIECARVEAWAGANEAWIENLVRKIRHLSDNREKQAEMEDRLLTHYLASEDMLGSLREASPEVWEALETGRNGRMNLLATEQSFDTGEPAKRFIDVRDREEQLYRELPGVDATTAAHLAWGTASEWLLECALDFVSRN